MKKKLTIEVFAGLVLFLAGLIVNSSGAHGHDPKDLSYWVRVGASEDWSSEAEFGKPQAQFRYGAL